MADFRIGYDNLITLPAGNAQTLAPGDRIIIENFERPSSANVIRVDTVVTPGVVDLSLQVNGEFMICNDTLNSCTLTLADTENWAPRHGMYDLPIAATPTKVILEVGPGMALLWIVNNDLSASYDLEIFGGPYV